MLFALPFVRWAEKMPVFGQNPPLKFCCVFPLQIPHFVL